MIIAGIRNWRTYIIIILSIVVLTITNIFFLSSTEQNVKAYRFYKNAEFDFIARDNVMGSNAFVESGVSAYKEINAEEESLSGYLAASVLQITTTEYDDLSYLGLSVNLENLPNGSAIVSRSIIASSGLKKGDVIYLSNGSEAVEYVVFDAMDDCYGLYNIDVYNKKGIILFKNDAMNVSGKKFLTLCKYDEEVHSEILITKKNVCRKLRNEFFTQILVGTLIQVVLTTVNFCLLQSEYRYDISCVKNGAKKRRVFYRRFFYRAAIQTIVFLTVLLFVYKTVPVTVIALQYAVGILFMAGIVFANIFRGERRR